MTTKKAILLAAIIFSTLQIQSNTFVCDGITYEPSSGETATVVAADSSTTYSGSILIPPSITNEGITYTVTAVAQRAFHSCSRLRSIVFPNSVTTIGEWAFAGCINLTDIKLPEGMTTITKAMLYGCRNLTSITLPSTVNRIEEEAFYSCSRLKNIIFNEGLTLIEEYAFSRCTSLETIDLPSSLLVLRGHAFNNCTSLASFTLPSSTYQVGINPFFGCTALTHIDVAKGNTHFCSIDGVLLNADATRLVCCPQGKTGNYLMPPTVTTIDEEAFFNCSGLTSIELSPILTMIGERALYGCSGIKTVTFPATTIDIGVRAMRECTGLRYLRSFATTPPNIYTTTFGETTNSLPLYVPQRAVETYQNTAFWKRFTDIRPIQEYFSNSDETVHRGAREYFTIYMMNAEPVIAFSFDIIIPEGFSLLTDGDAVKISEHLTDSRISVTITALDSTKYRVEGTAVGTIGQTSNVCELATLSVIVGEDLGNDEYTYSIEKAELTYSDGVKATAGGSDSFFEIVDGEMGDVNEDGSVSVVDVTQTVNQIMGLSGYGHFSFPLADMDRNGSISVTDVTGIVNKILGKTVHRDS